MVVGATLDLEHPLAPSLTTVRITMRCIDCGMLIYATVVAEPGTLEPPLGEPEPVPEPATADEVLDLHEELRGDWWGSLVGR